MPGGLQASRWRRGATASSAAAGDFTCFEAHGGITGTYDTIFPQPLGQDKSVIFEVQAANDAHLGFFSSAQSTDEVYEIVLSGWGNTQSVVRSKWCCFLDAFVCLANLESITVADS